jgi:DNA-binding IclR family transcriptional regulator
VFAALQLLTPRAITVPQELLRKLSQVQREGFVLVNEELELGSMSLTMPISAMMPR